VITLTMRNGQKRVLESSDLIIREDGIVIVEKDDAPTIEFEESLTEIRSISMSTAKGSLVIYKRLTRPKTGRPNGRPKTVDDSEVIELRVKGLSLKSIADKLGTTKSAVQRSLKRPKKANKK
jgi:DNA-binding NarL/FixJ family response regulator